MMAVSSGTDDFLAVENLSVQVGTFRLRNITLRLQRGQVLVVLGASGSGKSVLLESVAGFNRPLEGRIVLDGQEVTHYPPELRQMGFMFQDYALFPHLSVRANILFSQRFQSMHHLGSLGSRLVRRLTQVPVWQEANSDRESGQAEKDLFGKPSGSIVVSCPEVNERGEGVTAEKSRLNKRPGSEDAGPFSLARIVETLRIGDLLERYPGQLSGGEKQRVALARVLIQQPKLFLFDEPMSALDARTREELRAELGRILRTLDLTAVYVTHDQAEAWSLADGVCILREGRVVQTGKMEEVFSRPADVATARFIGMDNILQGTASRVKKMIKEDIAAAGGPPTLDYRSGQGGEKVTDTVQAQAENWFWEVEVPGLGRLFTYSSFPLTSRPRGGIEKATEARAGYGFREVGQVQEGEKIHENQDENQDIDKNRGIHRDKDIHQSKGSQGYKGIQRDKGIHGDKGIQEDKGIYGNMDIYGNMEDIDGNMEDIDGNEEIYLGIRPEDILVEALKTDQEAPDGPNLNAEPEILLDDESRRKAPDGAYDGKVHVRGEANHILAVVEEILPWGILCKLQFADPARLTALVLKQQVQGLRLEKGVRVQLYLPPERLHIML